MKNYKWLREKTPSKSNRKIFNNNSPSCSFQSKHAISDISRTNDRISLKKALSVWVSGVEHMNGVNWTISSLRRAEAGSLAARTVRVPVGDGFSQPLISSMGYSCGNHKLVDSRIIFVFTYKSEIGFRFRKLVTIYAEDSSCIS